MTYKIVQYILSILSIVSLAGCEPTYPPGVVTVTPDDLDNGPVFDISGEEIVINDVITDATEVLTLDQNSRYAAAKFKVKTKYTQLQVYVKSGNNVYINDDVRVSAGLDNPSKVYTPNGNFSGGSKHYEFIVRPAKTLREAVYHGIDGTPAGQPSSYEPDYSSGLIITEWFINIDAGANTRDYEIAVVATPGNAR